MSARAQVSDSERVFRQAWTLLGHIGAELKPANYELMCEVLAGRKPGLQERFKALPRPVRQEHLAQLIAEYLPHHGLPRDVAQAASGAMSAIETLQAEFSQSLAALDFQRKHIGVLKTRLPNVQELRSMVAQDAVIDVEAVLSTHDDTVRRLADVIETGQGPMAALKELLDLLNDRPVAANASVGPLEHGAMLHGLGDGQAMKSRLEQVYQPGEESVSLLLCHFNGLDNYRAPPFAQAGKHLVTKLSQVVKGLMAKDESAYWLTSDRIGVLLNTTDQRAVTQVGSEIGSAVGGSVSEIKRQLPAAPDVTPRFGAATSDSAATPAHFFMNANLALQKSQEGRGPRPVFGSGADKSEAEQRYSVLYGRERS